MIIPSASYHALLLGSAILTLAEAVTPALAQEPRSPFEFRGARLGMTLQEFEALPALGSARLFEFSRGGKKQGDGLLTKCAPSDDKVNAQIGVVDCQRAGDNPFTPQQYRYIYTSIGYKFGPDAKGDKRLFSILIITSRDYQEEAAAGLRAKWGNGKVVTSSVTNGFGQPLPKFTETWRQSGGSIDLESPCGDVTTICITYSDTGLLASLAGRRAAITGGPQSQF